jgi:tRNA (mo5U34)-methyltransferase
MGVLYHRRDPVEHLQQIRNLLRPGGRMLLETLVLADDPKMAEYHPVLVPENRYARMRNVWAVPATGRLLEWVERAGFTQARLLDVSRTTLEEQRSTPWMRFESLAESLAEEPNEKRPGLTVEGYPAPTRAIVVAEA